MLNKQASDLLRRTLQNISLASCRNLKIYPSEPPVQIQVPNKNRLPVLPKVPVEFSNSFMGKIPRGTREDYRLMGEERIHTDLQLGQFGVVAVHGGLITTNTFEAIRNYTHRKLVKGKSFAFYRVDMPYKAITSHGAGKKLGGGKGAVKYYSTPVKAGRVIMEVGGQVYWEEVQPWLKNICKMFAFEAIPVSQNILDKLNAEETRLVEANENPYSFEWMVRNNMFDCQTYLSPYDKKWFGKFVFSAR